jgi:hypothetical protein
MGFVAGTNVVEVDMVYEWQAERCENVYHVQMPAAVTLANLNALAAAFTGWEGTNGKQDRVNLCQLVSVVCTDLTTQNGLQVVSNPNPPIAGVGTSASMPNNVSCAIAWRTDLRGRSFRGRTFHIGLPESFATNNRLTIGAETSMATDYTALLSAVSAVTGAQLVVFSKQHNKAALNPGVTHVITHVSINTVLDSQKRRLPEHNRHH